MAKYRVLVKHSDGTESLEEEAFDTEQEAEDYGCYMISCIRLGAETDFMSKPGDYPIDDFEDSDFEIIEEDE